MNSSDSFEAVIEAPLSFGNETAIETDDATHLHRRDIDALIGRDYSSLRALIFRKAGDPQAAADLLNDAVCIALEKCRDGRIARKELIAGYVFQVAMNLLRNHRRSAAYRPSLRTDPAVLETIASDDDELDVDSEVVSRVVRIMRSMSSWRDRTLLVRFYLDEEDKDDICRDMGMTHAQFASVLHRARQRLREMLEVHGIRRSDVFSWLVP